MRKRAHPYGGSRGGYWRGRAPLAIAGKRLTQLTDGSPAVAPDWSPDGDKIAFHRIEGIIPTLVVMNKDGSDQRSLGIPGVNPAWSPDGKRIAFASVGANWDIFVVAADGTGLVRLTSGPGNENDPAWSPDGTRIAYAESPDDTMFGCRTPPIRFCYSDLYVMNADGSGRERLTDTAESSEFGPTWSPGGTRIAFWGSPSDAIFTIRADGSRRKLIAGGGRDPDWGP